MAATPSPSTRAILTIASFLMPLLASGCGGQPAKPPEAGKASPAAAATPAAQGASATAPASATEPKPAAASAPTPTSIKKPEDAADTAPRPSKLVLTTDQGQKVEVAADHDPWADRVVSYRMGTPAPKIARDPSKALGKPDCTKKIDAKRFVALGYGGELVLEFVDNRLVDGPGDDLVVFETGPAVESMEISISADGTNWIQVGRLEGARCSIDISPVAKPGQQFAFVKVVDGKAGKSNKGSVAGADIDAVGALNSVEVRAK